ncbi:MAG: zinc-binding dehydrogenase, partial [Rhodospirillales bacterium]|nr:zinc-binding dehydrogenase [Rhodospirillales bacterium]
GSAAVQLAKRRGAKIIAVSGPSKADQVKELGADIIIHRGDNLIEALGHDHVDAVVDLVAGPDWPQLLEVLKPGGRYAVSGAIAGPIVELDVRTLYLKDLTLLGCTVLEPSVFANLIGYIESGQVKPVVAKTYPLQDIVSAQKDFLTKAHTGKLVLEVPPVH